MSNTVKKDLRLSATQAVNLSEETTEANTDPAIKRPSSTFRTIRQGNATNTITKIRPVEGRNTTVDSITGTATITSGEFSLTIPNYVKLPGIKTSTQQLLDMLTIALTESGARGPTVTIPLANYMDLRNLKDRKEAKNQVKKDLEMLKRVSFSGEEKRAGNTESYQFVNLADSGAVQRNGDIVFTFGLSFYKMLMKYPVMPYPASLLAADNKKNPNSYFIGRKIAELKHMNAGKKNEDIISVKTLLSAAPFIPSYDEVMRGNKNLTSRIIEPFERDMTAQKDIDWEYCRSNGEPLTDKDLEDFSYNTFRDLLVKITWKNYPDQAERLARKAARIEASIEKTKAKRKSRPRKKKPDSVES